LALVPLFAQNQSDVPDDAASPDSTSRMASSLLRVVETWTVLSFSWTPPTPFLSLLMRACVFPEPAQVLRIVSREPPLLS